MGRNGEIENIKKGEYYEQLAGMVDEMMPEVVYQSVQATPRPSTNVPTCADELLEELGGAELFKRVLAIGYMDWQGFEKNRRKRLGEKYKPNTIREVATKFGISTSRLMDLRRGAAINREDTQRSKMLKAEKKEEAEGKTPTGSHAASPEEQVHATAIHLQGVKTKLQHKILGPFRDHQIFSKRINRKAKFLKFLPK